MHFTLAISVSKIHTPVGDAFFMLHEYGSGLRLSCGKKEVCVASVTTENTSKRVCSGFLVVLLFLLILLFVLCLFDVVHHESFCMLKTIVNVVANYSLVF